MRKDILLSLLVAGAMPTAAFPADVPNFSIETLTGTGVTLNEWKTVLTSTGVTITKTVELIKGEYTIHATTQAKIFVDGVETTTFTLTETKTVKIELKSADGKSFTVEGLRLEVKFDVDAAKRELSSLITTVAAKGSDAAAAGDAEAARIVRALGALQAEVDGWEDKYNYYTDWVNKTTYNKIKGFEAQLDGASANYDCMVYARDQFTALKKAIEDYQAGDYASATSYAKGKYDTTLTGLISELAALLNDVKTSYDNGSAATDFTQKKVDDKFADISKRFSTLQANVTTANSDDAAWNAIKAARETAQSSYLTDYKELNEKLNNEKDKDVYGDWFAEATQLLGVQYQTIITAEGDLNDDNHDGAAEAQDAAVKKINDAKAEITRIKNKYISKYNAQKAAYAAACDLVADLQSQLNSINNPDVTKKYTSDIANLQGLIDTLQEKIDGHDKAHNIVGQDYSADVDAIAKAINDFKNTDAVKKTIENYNTNESAKLTIASLKTKLENAKKAVVKAAVKDADNKVVYDADAHYTTTHDNLKTKIDTYSTELAAAYSNEEAVKYMTTGNGKIMGTTDKAITTYQTDAESSAEKYTTITNAIASYKTALDALKDKAKDTTVPVQAEAGETYGSKIAAMEEEINTLQGKLDAALAKKDAAHTSAMKALATINDFVSRANDLIDSYDADKAQWDSNEADRAWKVMYAQANARVEALLVNDIFNVTSDGLGNSWNGANGCANNIEAELASIKTRIQNESNKLDGLDVTNGASTVNAVNLALDKIETDITALWSKISTIKDAVKANKAAYDSLMKEFTASGKIDDLLNKAKSPYKDWNNDGKKKFDESRATLESTRDAIKAAIATGNTNETLVADRQDVKNENGTVKTKGLDTRIKDLNTDINSAKTKAQAAHDNYAAYNDLMNKNGGSINKYKQSGSTWLSVQKILDNTKTTVKNLNNKVQGAGEQFYLNLLDPTYAGELGALNGAILADYNNGVSKTAPTKTAADIKALVDKIEKAGTNATSNRNTYNAQVEQYKKTYNAYVEANKAIMAADYVTEKDNALAELGALLNTILSYDYNTDDGKIAKAFAEGASHTTGANYAKELLDLKTKIDEISSKFKDGYNEYIAADNKAIYDNFLLALAESTKALSEATQKLEQYKNIKNEANATAIAEVLKAYEGIYAYADKIFNLNASVSQEYTDANAAHEFFDRPEAHKAEAEAITAEIKKAQSDFTKAVNDEAWKLYQTRYNRAVNELQSNKDEIKGKDVFKAVLDTQFDKSTKLLDGIKAAYDANQDNEFALWLDGTDADGVTRYDQLDNISTIIASELVDAYRAIIASIDAQISTQYDEICNVFAYVSESERYNYINQYEAQVDLTGYYYYSPYRYVREQAEDAISGENLYYKIADIVGQLEDIKSEIDSIYNDAKKADNRQGVNKNAYDAMLALDGPLAKLQAALDAVEDWAAPMLLIEGHSAKIATVQNKIDGWKTEVEQSYRNGGAKAYQDRMKNTWDNQLEILKGDDRVKSEKHTAIVDERTELAKRIQTLQGAYTKAVNAVGAVDDNNVLSDYLKTQKEDIDALVAMLTTVQNEYKDKNVNGTPIYFTVDEMKAKCIAMEAKIAELHSTLAEIYDADLQQKLVDALNGTLTADAKTIIAKAKELVADLHAPVLNTYSVDVATLNDAIADAEAEIDAIDTEIAKCTTDKSIILYNDIIERHIENVIKAIKKANIASDAQNLADIDAKNEDIHNVLTGRIQAATNRLNVVMGVINAYESVVTGYVNWDSYESNLRNRRYNYSIEYLTDYVNYYYNYVMLSAYENALTSNCTTLDNNIENLLKKATYSEDSYQIGLSRNTLDAILIAEATSSEGRLGRRYFDGALKKLMAEDNAIGNLLTAATNYSNNVYTNNYTDVDVNGNYTSWYAYDYVTEAHPSIIAALEALNNRIAQLEDDAENSYYYIGSADGDDIVDVNDYTAVLNHLAGKIVIETPTAESEPDVLKKFYGADVNGDKAIRIGDLTAIAQIINGVYNRTNNFDNIPNKTPKNNAEADAICINASDNGTTQRLAISLKGSSTFSACQMDIILPEGISVASQSLGDGANAHNVTTNELEDGTYRVIVSSFTADALGKDDILYIDLNVSSSYTGGNIEFVDIYASDMNCNTVAIAAVSVGEATGIHTVSTMQDMKNRIYNVGGQLMNAMKRGMNIIVNEDGSTRKIMK